MTGTHTASPRANIACEGVTDVVAQMFSALEPGIFVHIHPTYRNFAATSANDCLLSPSRRALCVRSRRVHQRGLPILRDRLGCAEKRQNTRAIAAADSQILFWIARATKSQGTRRGGLVTTSRSPYPLYQQVEGHRGLLAAQAMR